MRADTGRYGQDEPVSVVDGVVPSRDDPVVTAASEVIGGPLGPRAIVGRSWWTPLRVLVLLAVVASLVGIYQHSPCVKSGWTDNVKVYTHGCYTDVVPLYTGRGLNAGVVPYFGDPALAHAQPVEYPVLTGLAMWVTSLPVPKSWTLNEQGVAYYFTNAAVDILLFILLVWATAKLARGRPWDAAMVALAPGVILTATINWDMWAVVLTAVAMLMWARKNPLLAGMFLGLGVSAKFYPLLLLGPLFLLALRTLRWRAFFGTFLATAITWLAVNVPVMATHFTAWEQFYKMSHDRGPDYGSIWLMLNANGVDFSNVNRLNDWGLMAFGALCVGIVVLTLTAARRPRFAQLAFLVVSAFILTNKVYSPQYVLWLIPLAVLARPRWRDFLLWQAAEIIYFLGVWWYIYSFTAPDRALPQNAYFVVVAVHLIALAGYCVMVVRDILLPRYDPVRATDGDDPTGGPFEDAPDRFTLGPWAKRRRRLASEPSRARALPVPTS